MALYKRANASFSSDPPRAHPLLGLGSLTETLTKFRSLVTALASLPITGPLPQSLQQRHFYSKVAPASTDKPECLADKPLWGSPSQPSVASHGPGLNTQRSSQPAGSEALGLEPRIVCAESLGCRQYETNKTHTGWADVCSSCPGHKVRGLRCGSSSPMAVCPELGSSSVTQWGPLSLDM